MNPKIEAMRYALDDLGKAFLLLDSARTELDNTPQVGKRRIQVSHIARSVSQIIDGLHADILKIEQEGGGE